MAQTYAQRQLLRPWKNQKPQRRKRPKIRKTEKQKKQEEIIALLLNHANQKSNTS